MDDEDESRTLRTALDRAMRFGETQYLRGLVAAFAALLLALDSRRVLAIADTRRMLQDLLAALPLERRRSPFGDAVKDLLTALDDDPAKARRRLMDVIQGGKLPPAPGA